MKQEMTRYNTIEYAVENKVGTLRLNRPKRYNSFNDEMHDEMRSVIKQIKKQVIQKELYCLDITGNGKGFCTGQDLTGRYESVKAGNTNLGKSLDKNYNPLIKSISTLPIPVVCAVNGVVAGAGIGLALSCDIVVAVQSANFIFAFSRVGLVPDSGSSWSVVQSIGLPRAKALSLLGDSLTAKDAEKYGLIWQCVEDGKLDLSVAEIVQRLLIAPSIGLALTKRVLDHAVNHNLQEQLSHESQLQTLAGRSEDYAEAVCAFVEKRPAVFPGKTE
ncbi:MAG: enoyl-CoA hydratase/isomerase family protein [Paraglaciecola sp.]|nr:enoyl-CoA hydratase/isomerase family protein [Paraglaciecola sp.]